MCLLGACAASDGQMCYMYCVRLFLQVSSVRIEASFWRRLLLMCVLCAFGILPHYTFRIVGYPISSSKLYHYPVPKLHEALASLIATTLCEENCLSCNNMHQCCALHNKRIGQLNAFMEKVNDFLPQSSFGWCAPWALVSFSPSYVYSQDTLSTLSLEETLNIWPGLIVVPGMGVPAAWKR